MRSCPVSLTENPRARDANRLRNERDHRTGLKDRLAKLHAAPVPVLFRLTKPRRRRRVYSPGGKAGGKDGGEMRPDLTCVDPPVVVGVMAC